MNEKDKEKLKNLNDRYKRQNKAIGEKYDRVSAAFPKGTKKRIETLGLSANGLINGLVLAELDRLEAEQERQQEDATELPF